MSERTSASAATRVLELVFELVLKLVLLAMSTRARGGVFRRLLAQKRLEKRSSASPGRTSFYPREARGGCVRTQALGQRAGLVTPPESVMDDTKSAPPNFT